jgi:2-iminobutanoate/2-iminopropanoate deaminase
MRNFILAATVLIGGATVVLAQSPSPNGVKTLAPEGAIKTTGTWDVGTRAGDFVFVAGMRGIDPKTNTLVQGDEARSPRRLRLPRAKPAISSGTALI